MAEKQVNLIQNLFQDIKKILEDIELKDINEANKYETDETKGEAQMWIDAYLHMDTYLTYRKYWKAYMFKEVLSNVKINNINYWMENPLNVPIDFRDTLLEKGREEFFNNYEEKNDYYRTLNGLPPYNTSEDEFIYLSDKTYEDINSKKDIPIHELSYITQNLLLVTDEYKQILLDNPDKKYLKYIGKHKIDLFVARKAKDFEIINYPDNNYNINPNILREFKNLYNDYREYVMSTLYNTKLEDLYVNYRTFMGLMIMSSVLMQISNKALESTLSKNFLDDSVIYTILSMYGIKKGTILSNKIRRNLVINLFKLIREKGTKDVYFDLIDILQYQGINVSKLMMAKGQKFNENSNYNTKFSNGELMTSFEDINKISFPEYANNVNNDSYTPESTPYFIKVDINDKNPYDSITNGNATIYDYHEIVDEDPTWWDMPDTQHILKYSNYTLADTKYIMIDSVVNQMQYLFESIYFPKIILDNKYSADSFKISIPELFGDETVSLYDIMIFIMSATCMINNIEGSFPFQEDNDIGLYPIAGFNFNIDFNLLLEYLNSTKYIDKDKIINSIDDIEINDLTDISRIYDEIIYPLREWLEYNLAKADIKEEYLEYESVYKALFTYDIADSLISDFETPMEKVRKKYSLSKEDINAYMHFYPRTINGDAITDISQQIRYTLPFISNEINVHWFVPVIITDPDFGTVNRGTVYFHDILNSQDIRTLTNFSGDRILYDWEDDRGWVLNSLALDELIRQITLLSESELNKAFFQVGTVNTSYNANEEGSVEYYERGEFLPSKIRNYLYKDILIDKILMDVQGLSEPPKSYLEYLYRKNETLYNLLIIDDRFNKNKEAWLESIRTIINSIEVVLDINVKYFEQSVIGSELFFKPLVDLINRFKSTYIHISKTGLKYIFGDKIDSGGNSQLLKLFDRIGFTIHYTLLAEKGSNSELSLYDVEHSAKYHIHLHDRSQYLKFGIDGYDVSERKNWMGSIHITDEAKFFKNGKEIDPGYHTSSWFSGEHKIGRWEADEEFIMQNRYETEKIKNPIDYEAWKDYVEIND